MNVAVLKLEKALSSVKSDKPAAKDETLETKRKFVLYFGEQLIALVGTWVQQVLLHWLVSVAPHALTSISIVSPQLGGTLTILCSGFTWLLLTVWSFKIRECLHKAMSAINVFGKSITKREIAACNRLMRTGFGAGTNCC